MDRQMSPTQGKDVVIIYDQRSQMLSEYNLELEEKVGNQEKLIEFMRDEYKSKTGKDFSMPTHLSLLFPQQGTPPSQRIKTEELNTLEEVIQGYNLPELLTEDEKTELRRAAIKAKKPIQIIQTNFDPKNPYHAIHSLELSDFRDKGFTKDVLGGLLDRTVEMKFLKSMVLRNCNLDDSYNPVLERLFSNKTITRIDLSRNRLGFQFVGLICRFLKEDCHFEWLDLAKNPLSQNFGACQTLVTALGYATKLFHICLDVYEQKPKQLVRAEKDEKKERSQSQSKFRPKREEKQQPTHLISTYFQLVRNRPQIHSFCPIETKVDETAAKTLCHILESKTHRLTCLNLSYSFIEENQLKLFSRSLSKNCTLVSLNLSQNGLFDWAGEDLLQSLKSNKTLMHVNLSRNRLATKFAQSLAKFLLGNSTLLTFDISSNPIGEAGAESLLKTLSDHNDSLESLGTLENCDKLSSQLIQKLYRVLRMNFLSKEFRNTVLKSRHLNDLEEEEIASAHTLAFLEAESKSYKLLEDVEVTNNVPYDPFSFPLWKLM